MNQNKNLANALLYHFLRNETYQLHAEQGSLIDRSMIPNLSQKGYSGHSVFSCFKRNACCYIPAFIHNAMQPALPKIHSPSANLYSRPGYNSGTVTSEHVSLVTPHQHYNRQKQVYFLYSHVRHCVAYFMNASKYQW